MSTVVGLIRFSFLSANPGEYRLTRGMSEADRAGRIFDAARLEQRFRLFETVCLPSLAAQPSDRFAAIVLTSAALPAAFRDRLDALLQPYSNVHAVYAQPSRTSDAFATAVKRLPASGPLRATFRLDDDDAIAADYSQRVSEYCTQDRAEHCVSLCAGWGLGRVRGAVRVWRRFVPLVSAGLARIGRSDDDRTIYHCGEHQSMAERHPVVLDGRAEAFVQTAHPDNDSGGRVPWPVRLRPNRALTLAQARAKLGPTFPFLNDPAIERL